MQATYTSRRTHRRDGKEHFAEITVRAQPQPGPGPSEVVLSPAVLAHLREVFGGDFEHARHCVWAAVAAQIDTANVAGEMPHVGATFFHAEVVEVQLSGNEGRELSGFLLSVAGMDAIGDYCVFKPKNWGCRFCGLSGDIEDARMKLKRLYPKN